MTISDEQRFADWRRSAEQRDLLETAVLYGATLKRKGREHTGPCVACGGTDRFSINPAKNFWHCRGHGGGHGAIGLTMHIAGMSFTQACEALTGEPNPKTGRKAKPLSDAELAERNRRRLAGEAAQRRREAEEASYQEDTREAAARIWAASKPIAGTLAESYLYNRGLPPTATDALRFHPALPYPKQGAMPALVCRVDDMGGELTAVWRIFLNGEGSKADVDNPKLGLGPAGGGAVRIGGHGRKIGLAEGVESALGAWNLIDRQYPVWATLSTSGLVGIELPLGVEHVVIFPDGDRPLRKQGNEYVPAVPAGRKAAMALRKRLLSEGVACTIAAEPAPGQDYLDLWAAQETEIA